MGITERHWFEDEEPELTEHQLEDIVYENQKAYDKGYIKGFHDALLKENPQIVRCEDCEHYRRNTVYPGTSMIMTYCAKTGIAGSKPDWFCADGERKTD